MAINCFSFCTHAPPHSDSTRALLMVSYCKQSTVHARIRATVRSRARRTGGAPRARARRGGGRRTPVAACAWGPSVPGVLMRVSAALWVMLQLMPMDGSALPGGPPIAGWSTWNTFACSINATLVKQGADHLVSSGLLAAGYDYIVRHPQRRLKRNSQFRALLG